VAACPSGAIYKREEDGIVLIDQSRCRGWRQCVSACPYKKIYFNWETHKSEKCTFCYPKIETGEPTICSESCVGRIRYIGVLLYDPDKILKAASNKDEKDIYGSHLSMFLNPNDPKVQEEAGKQGIPFNVLEAAKQSPVYKLAIDWKLAFPLHPEYRTLPMVWYIPPLSPVTNAFDSGKIGLNGILPIVDDLRIPNRYLANMFTAGDEVPVINALRKMLAIRAYMRSKTVDNEQNMEVLSNTGLTPDETEKMYELLAIANYGDRFIIPSSHMEYAKNSFGYKAACGFTHGENRENNKFKNLFGGM